MPIPLFGCQAHGGNLVSLDDPAVVKDLAALDGSGGSAYTGRYRSTPIADGHPLGWDTFRRFVQRVTQLGTATLKMTAFRDGQQTAQAIQRTLAAGDVGVVTAPFAARGSAFQVEVEVSAFSAEVQMGDAELVLVPRRTQR